MKKIVAATMLAAIALTTTGCSQVNKREVTITVQDKERVCESGNSSCKYLVFTDKGTFQNSDSLLSGKFDSSDVYGRLDEGKTYVVKVAGFRQGILSMYPNIIEVVEEK